MGRLSYARSELASRQKPARGVSLYSRWINRPLGQPVAAVAYAFRMTPNQVTAVSAALSAAGVLLLATAGSTWSVGVIVWLLLAGGFVVDSADGQVARLTNTSSARGEWLDHLVDAGKTVAVHSAVLVAFFRSFDFAAGWQLIVPLVFQLAALVSFFAGTLAGVFLHGAHQPSRPPSTARSVALLPVDYGVFCLVFVLLGNHTAFLICYTILAGLTVVFTVGMCGRWFIELAGCERSGQ